MCLKSPLCFKTQDKSVLSGVEQVMNNPRLKFEEWDKIKERNELLKISSFEHKDVPRGSPSDPSGIRSELTAASPTRILTMLMRFSPKKVLPPSGAVPHLWETGKTLSPTWILQLRLPQNSIPNLCEFQVSIAHRSSLFGLLYTH